MVRVIAKSFGRPDNLGQTGYDVDLELSPCRVVTGLHQLVIVSSGEYATASLPTAGGTGTPMVWCGVGPGHPESGMNPVPEDEDGWVPNPPAYGAGVVSRAVCPAGAGGMYTAGIGGMDQSVWPPFPPIPYTSTGPGCFRDCMTDANPGWLTVRVLRNGVTILSSTCTRPGTGYWVPEIPVETTSLRIYDGDVITWEIDNSSYYYMDLANSFCPIPSYRCGVFWLTRTGD